MMPRGNRARPSQPASLPAREGGREGVGEPVSASAVPSNISGLIKHLHFTRLSRGVVGMSQGTVMTLVVVRPFFCSVDVKKTVL